MKCVLCTVDNLVKARSDALMHRREHLMPGDIYGRLPHSLQLFNCKKQNQCSLPSLPPLSPLLLLLHLLVPLAPVKANMLETSLEHSHYLEARL